MRPDAPGRPRFSRRRVRAAIALGLLLVAGVALFPLLRPDSPPLALVYRGPASCSGCPESVAAVLTAQPLNFRVEYVGPDDTPLTADTLRRAAVYAQPGGGTLADAWRQVRGDADVIRSWVADGGVYLGFCLGGYLAGATPGFGLLPGDTSRYLGSPDASIDDDEPRIGTVTWRDREYRTYFQDPPRFIVTGEATVLARYPNGEVAALVAPFGSGRVAVTGPHVEATDSWYSAVGLDPTGAVHTDLAVDFVRSALDSASP